MMAAQRTAPLCTKARCSIRCRMASALACSDAANAACGGRKSAGALGGKNRWDGGNGFGRQASS